MSTDDDDEKVLSTNALAERRHGGVNSRSNRPRARQRGSLALNVSMIPKQQAHSIVSFCFGT